MFLGRSTALPQKILRSWHLFLEPVENPKLFRNGEGGQGADWRRGEFQLARYSNIFVNSCVAYQARANNTGTLVRSVAICLVQQKVQKLLKPSFAVGVNGNERA